MSRESGPERTQRTVAELLAQHGASASGSSARRRRRRADDGEESTPKTIIDRVLSDSGRLRQVGEADPVEPEQPAPEYPAAQQPPAALRQASPREASVPQLPAHDDSVAYRHDDSLVPRHDDPLVPRHDDPFVPRHDDSLVPRHDDPLVPRHDDPFVPRHDDPFVPRPDDSFVPRPDDSFVPRPDEAPPTELLPATDPILPRRGGGAGRSGYLEPPSAGLPQVRPPVPPAPPTAGDAEATAQYAPITDNTPPPRPAAGFRTGRRPRPVAPPEPMTEQIPRITQGLDPNLTTEIPAISAPPLGHGSGGPETESWFHADGFAGEAVDETGSPEAYHQDGYYEDEDDGYAEDEYDQDEFAEEGAEHGRIAVDEAAADEDLLDEEYDEEETKRSPAKEWLVMVTQLGAGVIGGGGLWLGFQYLWRAMPAVALGVAVVITVGLVWMVRKIRRADDLQTIVLAVLVGLVVTVSPAALLLVGR